MIDDDKVLDEEENELSGVRVEIKSVDGLRVVNGSSGSASVNGQ